MNKELLNDIDAIITCFEIAPSAFGDNVWQCYTDCKQVIYKAENDGVIPYDPNLYDKYIKHITDKLDI